MNSASIEPWLTVSDGDGQKALGFYREAFNATETYRLEGDGNDVVARLSIFGAGFWISNGATGQSNPDISNMRLILIVDDPVPIFAAALKAGATEIYPVSEEHGWKIGRLSDPFGFHWEIGHSL
jgi:PhnB protein